MPLGQAGNNDMVIVIFPQEDDTGEYEEDEFSREQPSITGSLG